MNRFEEVHDGSIYYEPEFTNKENMKLYTHIQIVQPHTDCLGIPTVEMDCGPLRLFGLITSECPGRS
jgi:hypothetical protein